MTNFSPKNSSNLLKQIIFYTFLIIFTLLIIKQFLINKSFSDYVFQEWMVNYSQGFIRRGLTGNFLLFLPETYLIWFSYLTFILFSSIYLWKVKQSLKILNWESLMVVLFLPSLILFPIKNPDVIGKKEFYFFFGLIINLFFVSQTFKIANKNQDLKNSLIINDNLTFAIKKYCYSLFIWYNLLSIPTTLTHEAIIFLNLPLNIIITATLISFVLPFKQVLWRTLIIYLPTILLAIICIVIQGDENLAQGICESWQEYSQIKPKLAMDCGHLTGVLIYYNASIKDVLIENWETNIIKDNYTTLLNWLIVFSLSGIILIKNSAKILTKLLSSSSSFQITNAEDNYSNSFPIINIILSFSFKYLLLPFIASLILYVIAFDWGRWFFIISISYILCLLTPSLIQLEIMAFYQNKTSLPFLYFFSQIYAKSVYYFKKKSYMPHFNSIYLLILFYTLFCIRIPNYGIRNKDLYFNLLYSLLDALVKIKSSLVNIL